MKQRLISGIYEQGDISYVHHVRGVAVRPSNWAYAPARAAKAMPKVPKNKRVKQVNVWQHAWEMQHGIGSAIDDPLMEMLK